MLDISIKSVDKAITSKKKASDFVRTPFRVLEKIDGTKLTLIRNDEPFNPEDYTKNWIVSYKGRIIYPTEFNRLVGRHDEIKSYSLGTAQYKFVHDHLKKVHPKTGRIPHNTEFFVEFVQNKPTVTRDYNVKHGLFLVGFGPADYAISRGHIFSTGSFGDQMLMLHYREVLQLESFKPLFEGNFSSPDEILKGCIDDDIRSAFYLRFSETNFSDPLSVLDLVTHVFSRFKSSLGGPAEGVVLQSLDENNSLFKILAPDQHSKEVRSLKKARFVSESETDEETYKLETGRIAKSAVSQIPEDDLHVMFDHLSRIVYSLHDLPYHPRKRPINIQEDIFLIAKMGILYAGTNDAKKIGIIPMAAKPFHKGHDSLLCNAFQDGMDSVILFLSIGDRDGLTSGKLVPLWRKIYLPLLQAQYGKALSIMFSTSPMTDAMKFARNFAREGGKYVTIYGGIDPLTGKNDAYERLKLVLDKNPELSDLIRSHGIDRNLTDGISGSEMRGFLTAENKDRFCEGLPHWINTHLKDEIWSALK